MKNQISNHQKNQQAQHILIDKLKNLGVKEINTKIFNRRKFIEFTINGETKIVYFNSKTKGTEWQLSLNHSENCDPNIKNNKFWILIDIPQKEFFVMPERWLARNIYDVHNSYIEKHGGHRPVNQESTHHSKSVDEILIWKEAWHIIFEEQTTYPYNMKGQVFTVAKLHYVNGVVYEVARLGETDMQTLADLSAKTTKSGKAKHPMVRVRTLARLAEGVGLINIVDKKIITITSLGTKYSNARAGAKWSISNEQQQVLGKYIISDYYRTETIYSITSLFELIKKGYTGEELSHQFSREIGKDNAWKSEITFQGFTKFCSSYISELGLLDIDEKDIRIEDISREQRYQNDINIVNPISIPSGKIPRPKPRKYGGSVKYAANPRRARNALEEADFKCELNPGHVTFINKRSSKQYMEAHHLIPMSKQGSLEYDIDVPENILCLCPTCHRKIHLAQDDDKKEILSKAFQQRNSILPRRGISINIENLFDMYAIA